MKPRWPPINLPSDQSLPAHKFATMNDSAIRNILIIEPAWGGSAHFPFNLGLLRACLGAFPLARIQLLGESAQQTAMQPYLTQDEKLRCDFEAWTVHADADTLPGMCSNAGVHCVNTRGKRLTMPKSLFSHP